MGPDPILPTTEISTVPCAGVRIPYGKLTGLMAWRFVVELDDPPDSSHRQKQKQKLKDIPRPGIVSNFILDTGSSESHVSQEALRALGYKGSYKGVSSRAGSRLGSDYSWDSWDRNIPESPRCLYKMSCRALWRSWTIRWKVHDLRFIDILFWPQTCRSCPLLCVFVHIFELCLSNRQI